MSKLLSLVLIGLVILACGSEIPSEVLRETQRSLRLSGVEEEEVFGRVFKFGEHATLSDGPYEVRLVPLGTTTMPSGAARRMLVDPAADGGPDWGWFDAFRGGQ